MSAARRSTGFVLWLTAFATMSAALGAGRQRPDAPGGVAGQPAKGTGIVVGQVVDGSTGQPIAEAVVTLNARPNAPIGAARGAAPPPPGGRGAGATPDRVMTGQDGRFLFRELPAGPVMFTATAAGYGPGVVGQTRPGGPSQPVQLGEGGRVSDARIRLWRFASITGTIVDDAGEPAVRTTVRVLRRTMAAGRPRYLPTGAGTTDDRGQYRIGSLMAGDYLVVVPQTAATVPAASAESFLKAISSGGAGQGALMMDMISSDGPPPNPNGIRVGDHLLSVNPGMGAMPPAPSADGRVLAYQTMLFPGATSPSQATVITLGSGEERTGINIQMRLVSTARLSGSVVGPAGPMANVTVRLFPAADSDLLAETEFPVATSMTGADGAFLFLAVPPGQFVVRVQKSPPPVIPAELGSNPLVQMVFGGLPPTAGRGAAPAPTRYANANVTVGSTATVDVALRLREGAKLSGRVEFEGTTPPPAPDQLQAMTITLNAIDGRGGGGGGFPGAPAAPGRVGQDGQFATQGYAPGRYFVAPAGRGAGPAWTLKSVTANGRDVSVEPLELTDTDVTGAIVTFTDKVGQVSGTIRTATGTAPDEATVLLFPADYRGWARNGMSPRRLASATLTKATAFTLPRLLAGEYLIAAVATLDPNDREDPAFFEALSRVATRLTLGEGEQRSLDLSIVRVTR
jgi:hypothetical protein